MFLTLENSNFNVKRKISQDESYQTLKITAEKQQAGEYTKLSHGLTLHTEKKGAYSIFNIISTSDIADGRSESLLKFIIKDSKILISKEKSKKNRETSNFLQFINLAITENTVNDIFEELEAKSFDLSNVFLKDILAEIVGNFEGTPDLEEFEIKFVQDCYLNDLSATDEEIARNSWFYMCPMTQEICYDKSDLIAVRLINKHSLTSREEHAMLREKFGIKEPMLEFTFVHKSAEAKFRFRSACIKRVEESAQHGR